MIVRNKPGLWDLAFAMRGSVLPHIARPLLTLMLVAAPAPPTGPGHQR